MSKVYYKYEPSNYKRPQKYFPANMTNLPSDVRAHMDAFIQSQGYMSYLLVHNTPQNPYILQVFRSMSNPCMGELRKYTETHKTATRAESRPSDLHNPLPEGNIVGAAIPCRNIEVFDSPDSPYKALKLDKQVISDKGIIVLDTRIDLTLLVSMVSNSTKIDRMLFNQITKDHPDWPLWKRLIISMTYSTSHRYVYNGDDYYLPSRISLTRWSKGDPIDVTTPPWDEEAGNLWINGIDYNRTSLHMIWAGRTDLSEYNNRPLAEKTVEGYASFIDKCLEAEKDHVEVTREDVFNQENDEDDYFN